VVYYQEIKAVKISAKEAKMAVVEPFRGYRYNPQLVGDLKKVVAQPYDKIGPELQAEYHQRSPYNIAQVTKSIEKNQDPETPYPKAGAKFQEWIINQVLVPDVEPGFYAYYQIFKAEGKSHTRKGLVGLVALEGGTQVRAHEKTLAGPKADRLRLMRATEGNDGQIFMLYSDPKGTVNRVMDKAAVAKPLIEVPDDFGEIHKLWQITDPQDIKDIKQALADKELFIADGHHRYETAVNFMNECRAKGWKPMGVESFTHRMMTMISMDDPDLVILATHRLVRDLPNFQLDNFLRALREDFIVEPTSVRHELYRRLEAGKKWTFGLGADGGKRLFLVRLKDGSVIDKRITGKMSSEWKSLDVTVLHSLILERLLGIDAAKLEAQSHVDYGRDKDKGLERLSEGKYQLVFLMNPTGVRDVQAVASAGERMPQKSTDFYPKLLTGMVFMKMKIQK
jgi:uncharacterized protein (DUF1015 family)